MIDEQALARTKISATFTIAPLENVMGDIAGLLADSQLKLLAMFYPPRICRKANVVITELVTNVFENISDPKSSIELDVRADAEMLFIRVINKATDAQYDAVKRRVDEVMTAENPQRLLAKTLRERRVHRLKGGLGLMRLVAENKFKIAASYEDGRLFVEAKFSLKDFV